MAINFSKTRFIFFAAGVGSLLLVVSLPALADNSDIPVPSTFFGMIINKFSDTSSLSIPFGQFRLWDSEAQWPDIETGNGQFTWGPLDNYLQFLKTKGVNDIFYTMSRTPLWATINPNDTTCNYADQGPAFYGECDLWADINADGTGTNTTWRTWVAAIAGHVNDSSYIQTHAHIKYWEIWNEFERSTVLTDYQGQYSFQGTYAELVRLMEDANCIITGRIPKITATGESCSQVLNTVGLSAPIDPGAKIVAPSGAPFSIGVFQNLMYCNGTGKSTPKVGSQCIVGNAGAQAIDIVNYHFSYGTSKQPFEGLLLSDISNIKTALQPAELAKPLWSGEEGWGEPKIPGDALSDPDAQAAYIGRFSMMLWSVGITNQFWYTFDLPGRALWNSSTGLTPAGVAWGQVYNWMVDATMNRPCAANGTVWTCSLVRSNGYVGQAVWDTSQSCNQGVCATTPYPTGTPFTQYRDLAGNTVSITGSTVPVGIKPIILENFTPNNGSPATPGMLVRVYPNPWRADKDTGSPITFDQLTGANVKVKIFTLSGHLIKTLTATGASVTWDLTNDSGSNVASGIYLFLAANDTQKTTGKFVIIR